MRQQVQRWSNRFHQRDKLLMLRTDVIEGEEAEMQKLGPTGSMKMQSKKIQLIVWSQQLKTDTSSC